MPENTIDNGFGQEGVGKEGDSPLNDSERDAGRLVGESFLYLLEKGVKITQKLFLLFLAELLGKFLIVFDSGMQIVFEVFKIFGRSV